MMGNDFWTMLSATLFVCLGGVALFLAVINVALTQELTRVAKKINHQLDRIEGVQAAQANDFTYLREVFDTLHHNGPHSLPQSPERLGPP